MSILGNENFSPILPRSLKDEFIERFETLILSGKFRPGDRVPSERDLGVLFGISRPVVHEGLRTLESRGLVTIESRKGVRVNDYRREGSIEMLLSILNFAGGRLSPTLFNGVLEMRLLFEVETAGLAAKRRSQENLAELRASLEHERAAGPMSARAVADIDFAFHISIAIASGNEIYPLLMNSFRRIYQDILEAFYADESVIGPVFTFHSRIAEAIEHRDEAGARGAMLELLNFSETNLRRILFGPVDGRVDGEVAPA
jgi:DNA-binding FadR family transcriptional regulator